MAAQQAYNEVWPAGFSYMQIAHMKTHPQKTAEEQLLDRP